MTETLATWGAWERAIRDDRSITSCRPALSARCAGAPRGWSPLPGSCSATARPATRWLTRPHR